MEQTAVDYLIQEIKNDVFVHSKSTKEWNVIFKQAKSMYEQEINNEWRDGYNEGVHDERLN
jgi:hypothetical protein